MKTIKVKYGGFEAEQCVDDALYDAIYEKGRADAKREANEFFNFDGARELADTTTDCEDCERRIRAEAIYKAISIADCPHTDCWECAFGDAEMCKLQQLYGQFKERADEKSPN